MKFLAKYFTTIMTVIITVVFFLLSDKDLLGGIEPGVFFRFMFFATLGSYIGVQVDANYRDINSPYTPTAFSHKVMIKQNFTKFVNTALLIFIAVRFIPELWPSLKLNDFTAFLVGAAKDLIPTVIKNRRNILASK